MTTSFELRLRTWLDRAYASQAPQSHTSALVPAALSPTAYRGLPQLLLEAFEAFAHLPALTLHQGTEPSQTLSYAELAAQVKALAARLQSLGLSPGTQAALLAPTQQELLIASLAVALTGAKLLVLEHARPSKQIVPLLLEAQPLVLITDGSRYLRLSSLGTIPASHVVLLPWRAASSPDDARLLSWEEALATPRPFEAPSVSADDVAFQTVATARLVAHSQGQLLQTLQRLQIKQPAHWWLTAQSPSAFSVLLAAWGSLSAGRQVHLQAHPEPLSPAQSQGLTRLGDASQLTPPPPLSPVAPVQSSEGAHALHALKQGLNHLRDSLAPKPQAPPEAWLLALAQDPERLHELLEAAGNGYLVLECPWCGLPMGRLRQSPQGAQVELWGRFEFGASEPDGFAELFLCQEATGLWLKPFVGGGYLLR